MEIYTRNFVEVDRIYIRVKHALCIMYAFKMNGERLDFARISFSGEIIHFLAQVAFSNLKKIRERNLH